MSSAMDQGFEYDTATHEQGTYALGCINLMAGNRQKIDAEVVDAGRDLADGLRRVGMEQGAVLMGNAGAVLDRLDGADLIVGMHDADQDGTGTDWLAEFMGIVPFCFGVGEMSRVYSAAVQ